MPFAPGKSGNPGGRASTKPFLDALKFQLAKAGEDNAALRRIAQKVIDEAEAGQQWAVQLLWDRIDGKVPQPVEVDQTVTHIAIDERQARIRELQQKAITTSYREVEEE
jgi:hypothetical protein